MQRISKAVYASDPDRSIGRLFAQKKSVLRDAFQRDRDRIIHCTAFRRLKHKTQVFVAVEGDHFRTRLTHSLEVAQIARTMARALHLNEDLTETLALAHDLGHTAFGHAGETALDACMAPYGGFDHNAHGLRIVTQLEQPYPGFDGLNLTWETLEGLVKHNGPLLNAPDDTRALPWGIREFNLHYDLTLASYASAEAQVAAIADDIAYDNHDLDDGLSAGLFSLHDVLAVPLVYTAWQQVKTAWPRALDNRLVGELIRTLIGNMVADVLAETMARLKALSPQSVHDIRSAGINTVGFSSSFKPAEQRLKKFLKSNMYMHPMVLSRTEHAETVVKTLFDAYMQDVSRLPDHWVRGFDGLDEYARARRISDFIAGATDTYALGLYNMLAQ